MSDSLPATFDPIRLAEEGAQLSGSLRLHAMPRLGEQDEGARVAIDLQFERAGKARWEMRGEIRATLRATCQRCLRRLTLDVQAQPSVVFVRSESEAATEAAMPAESDVVVATQPLVLKDFVEDELLLAMPMIPLHPPGSACELQHVERRGDEKKNPFAVLSELKNRKDSH